MTHHLARAAARAGANLPHADAHHVVEPAIALVVAEVCHRDHDLPPLSRIRPRVAAGVEQDRGAVLGLDHALEVGERGPVDARARMVAAPGAPAETALAAALAQEEVVSLAPVRPLDGDAPPLGVA